MRQEATCRKPSISPLPRGWRPPCQRERSTCHPFRWFQPYISAINEYVFIVVEYLRNMLAFLIFRYPSGSSYLLICRIYNFLIGIRKLRKQI